MPSTRAHHGFRGLLLVLALAPGLASADSAPAASEPQALSPFSATYTAAVEKGLALNGSGTRKLTDSGNGVWLYQTDVSSFVADIHESLVLKWEDDRVIPITYRYRLSGLFIRDRSETIDFDWSAGVATGEAKGKAFRLPLKPGTLDPLGYQLQLRQDLRRGKRDVTYQVIDHGKYDDTRFAVVDDPAGDSGLVKAEKVREADAKRQTYLWFDPERAFLLMRLLQVEPDGERYELRLKDAQLGR
ncbi:DUF3108 domain-containing protein [Marinobacter sp. C2H3]|uniref:DUF3108 domain-containing protein n=1 Tax=Marinobacter sp. C2H3 TaxID=3119003 RepID=UPI00300F511E